MIVSITNNTILTSEPATSEPEPRIYINNYILYNVMNSAKKSLMCFPNQPILFIVQNIIAFFCEE